MNFYRAEVQWVYDKEIIYYLKGLKLVAPKKKKVGSTKAATYFFYVPTILISTLSRIQYRGCGNLAASTGSTMKSSTSSFLTIFKSLRCSILFEYLKLPVPLAVAAATAKLL